MELLISILIAFCGGFFPALIWLYFWLKEDEKHPEPNALIFRTFLFGMLAVPVAFLMQLTTKFFLPEIDIQDLFFINYPIAIISITLWSLIEEGLKYRAAKVGGLMTRENDEPVDSMVYMITAALGFAALENMLFLMSPILAGDTTVAFITGNMRFIGATLVHVASSSIVGLFLALSFYRNKKFKKRYLIVGITLATTLHTIFNSFIIRAESFTLVGFFLIWVVIIFLIIAFEKIKRIYFKN